MSTPPRPLPELRSLIDTLDRDLLELLARRMALVAEAAAYKQAHGLPIHDEAREQRVLRDRRRWAEELGLPADYVDAIVRLLLQASREHQGAQRPGPSGA